MSGNEPFQNNRRGFLGFATLGVGTVVVGSGFWGLGQALAPDASVVATDFQEVDLASIPMKEQRTFSFGNKPIFVRRLSPDELRTVSIEDFKPLLDPLARNQNLSQRAEASVANRILVNEAGAFVVIDGRCTRGFCLTLDQVGDFGGWFCPCCGSHYDVVGRIRKGPAPENMQILRFDASGSKLTLLPASAGPSNEHIRQLLYGIDNV